MKCPICGTKNLPGSTFCENCGNQLGHPQSVGPQETTCPKCGHSNMTGSTFCDNCGASLSGAPSPIPSIPQPGPSVQPPSLPPSFTPPPPTTGEIVCPNCNSKNPAGTLFCDVCGKNLSQVDVVPSVSYSLKLENGTLIQGKLAQYMGRNELGGYVSNPEAAWISRTQFKIDFKDGKFQITDDRSTNGTKINDEEIKGKGEKEIKNGDTILVADFLKLIFQTL